MKLKKIIFVFIVGICISQAGSWTSVEASVISSQTVSTSSISLSTPISAQPLNTGTSTFTVSSLDVTVNIGTGTGNEWVAQITDTTTGTYYLPYFATPLSGCTINVASWCGSTGGKTVVSNDFTKGVRVNNTGPIIPMPPLVSGHTYQFSFFKQLGGTVTPELFYGNTGLTGSSNAYFVLNGTSSPSALGSSAIYNISPADGDITASTTVPFSFTYYFQANQLPFPVTQIDAVLTRVDTVEPPQTFSYSSIVTGTPTNVTDSWLLPSDAEYNIDFFIHAKDVYGNPRVLPFGGVSVDFFVISNPSSVYVACDVSNIAGCFQNAMLFLFRPSNDSIVQFQSINLKSSFPFSYIYDVGNLFNELFAGGGSMTYSLSIPFLSGSISLISPAQLNAIPYTATIRLILGWLLYFMSAMFIYRIILKQTYS